MVPEKQNISKNINYFFAPNLAPKYLEIKALPISLSSHHLRLVLAMANSSKLLNMRRSGTLDPPRFLLCSTSSWWCNLIFLFFFFFHKIKNDNKLGKFVTKKLSTIKGGWFVGSFPIV